MNTARKQMTVAGINWVNTSKGEGMTGKNRVSKSDNGYLHGFNRAMQFVIIIALIVMSLSLTAALGGIEQYRYTKTIGEHEYTYAHCIGECGKEWDIVVAIDGNDTHKSCSDAPVNLNTGNLFESATDLTMHGATFTWSHYRNYSSHLVPADEGEELASIQGFGWKVPNIGAFIACSIGYDVTFYVDSHAGRDLTYSDVSGVGNHVASYEPGDELDIEFTHYRVTSPVSGTSEASCPNNYTLEVSGSPGYTTDLFENCVLMVTTANGVELRTITGNDSDTITVSSDTQFTTDISECSFKVLGQFVLKEKSSGRVFCFRDCDLNSQSYDSGWEDNEQGLLWWESDAYGKSYRHYVYSEDTIPGGRIESITTSEGWRIEYSYDALTGQISTVEIVDEDDDTIKGVLYTYYRAGEGYSTDCGSDGDLILVQACDNIAYSGTAASGSDYDTLIVADAGYDSGDMVGNKLIMLTGDNQYQVRTISAHTSGGGNETFTVSPAFSSNISSGDKFWIARDVQTTHYRYHTDSSSDGFAHQMKSVFKVEAVEAILDDAEAGDNIDCAYDILAKADSFGVGADDKDVDEYATRAFTYYKAEEDGNAADSGTKTQLTDSSSSWGEDDLIGKIIIFTSGDNEGEFREISDNTSTTIDWTTDLPENVASGDTYRICDPIVTQENYSTKWGGTHTYDSSDHSLCDMYGGIWVDNTYCVKTERLNGACGGCGGGSNVGVKLTYYYMAVDKTTPDEADVVRLTVIDYTATEESQAEDNLKIKRKIYGTNPNGSTLREVTAVNPDPASTQYWCQSTIVSTTSGTKNLITEKRMPSAHTGVTTTNIDDFFDPDTGDSSTLNDSSGLIYLYTYNANGYRTDVKVKKGENGTAYYVSATDYGDGAYDQLPTATYAYPEHEITSRTDASRITTGYTYTFWDWDEQQQEGEKTQLKTRVTEYETVPTTQNGPDTGYEATFSEYYDEEGRLRWTQDAEDNVNYYAYNLETGGLAYTVVDVDTSSMAAGIEEPDGTPDEWTDWSDTVPFSSSGSNKLQLVTKYKYDSLARQVQVEQVGDSDSVIDYTVYDDTNRKVMVFSAWKEDYDSGTQGNQMGPLPTQVTEYDIAGRTIKSYTVDPSKTTTSGGVPTGLDSGTDEDDYYSLTAYEYNDKGQLWKTRRYHNISSSSDALDTNYYLTVYNYDAQGRREYTVNVVSGTSSSSGVEQVTKVAYDNLDRVTATYIAVSDSVDDMTSDYDDYPTLTQISATFYDEAEPGSSTSGVGDGMVTSTKRYYDAANIDDSHMVETVYYYNYRGYLRGVKPADEPYMVQDVDNLGRVTASAIYKGNLTWTGSPASVADDPDYAATVYQDGTTGFYRGSLSTTAYDNMGRAYRTCVYAVDADDGTLGDKIVTDNFYDGNSRLLCSRTYGTGAVEYAYDGAGRSIETRVILAPVGEDEGEDYYTSGIFNYRNPQPNGTSGGDDNVIQISRTVYDKLGNITESISMEANHDDSTAGLNISNNDDYVQTAVYSWYDTANRRTATAVYGTCDSSWTYHVTSRPSTAPSTGETVLVTGYSYSQGRLSAVTDPKGIVTSYEYDDLGRTVKTIENDIASPSANDEDRTTLAVYDGLSNVVKQIADLDRDGEDTDDQVTTYTYGDSYNASLVTKVQYPDGDSTDDCVKLEYGLDGSLTKRTAQKNSGDTATEITYEYDSLRRPEKERVTAYDADIINNSVLSIKRTYDTMGRITNVTSYSTNDCSGTPANEVVYEYNDLGALAKECQEYDGAKDANTLHIDYAYDDTDGDSDGIYDNAMRLESITYPNGRTLYYDYGSASSIGDLISRVASIKETDSNGDPIVTYSYNGVGRIVGKDYPTPDISLDYFGGSTGTYAGFDRFGRVTKQYWYDNDEEAPIFDIRHAYDYNSNRTYADRQVYGGYSQYYTYDDLNRLATFNAGMKTEDSGVMNGVASYWKFRGQGWTLDQVGNQTTVNDFGRDHFVGEFNDANEYDPGQSDNRKVSKSGKAWLCYEEFSTPDCDWDVADDSDEYSISGDKLTIGTMTGNETILLLGEDIGPTLCGTSVAFDSGALDGDYAGIVFGYKSVNDYWMLVWEVADTKSTRKLKLYHVVSGTKTPVAYQSTGSSYSSGTFYTLVGYFKRNSCNQSEFSYYDFQDGFPSGKIGIIASAENTQFDYFHVEDPAVNADTLGRWMNNNLSMYATTYDSDDCLYCSTGSDATYNPILLRNTRLDNFRMTFSCKNSDVDVNRSIYLVFNAKDQDHFNFLTLFNNNSGSPGVPYGWKFDDGYKRTAVSGTQDSYYMPTGIGDDDKLWYRIVCNGTTVKVYCDTSEGGLDTKEGDDHYCYSSANFDMDGGRLGFARGNGGLYIDDVTVQCDGNSDGDFSDNEDYVETVDTFEINGNYGEDKITSDAAGNLTYDGCYKYTYDAWNRLVTVQRAYRDSGGDLQTGSTIATMEYDGLGRRITKAIDNCADQDATYHYYYNGQQLIETRNGSDYVLKQHVWGLQYIDELVQIGINQDPANADSPYGSGYDENECERFYYVCQDANFNVMGVVNSAGLLTERYEYTPYGQRTVYSHGWFLSDIDDDGDVDLADRSYILNNLDSLDSNCRRADLNGDGYINSTDIGIWSAETGSSVATDDPLVMHSRLESFRCVNDALGCTPISICDIGHQGLMHDKEFDLIYNRARAMSPRLGRFIQRDPLGYVDGMSVYEYVGNGPTVYLDPYGTQQVQEDDHDPVGEDLHGGPGKVYHTDGDYIIERSKIPYPNNGKLAFRSKATGRRFIRECQVILFLGHRGWAEEQHIAGAWDKNVSAFGFLSCYADIVNRNAYITNKPGSFKPVKNEDGEIVRYEGEMQTVNEAKYGLIPDFPRIRAPFGKGAEVEEDILEAVKDRADVYGLTNEAALYNGGNGLGREAAATLVTNAWNAAVEHGKNLAKDCRCKCKYITVKFVIQGNSIFKTSDAWKEIGSFGDKVEKIKCLKNAKK